MEQEFKHVVEFTENELRMAKAALNLYCATFMSNTAIDQDAFDKLDQLAELKTLYNKVCNAKIK